VDPITVEVVGSAFVSVAEEMGEALVRASFSDNIKERRDSSTAIFDARGRTLAQAAHIPIHLGSLLGVVECVLERYPVETLREGDMFIGNDPYTALGTHLPDIVVTAPIFYQGRLVAFAANLGHHQDFFDRGQHRHIWQEGLRIPPTRIMSAGEVVPEVLNLILVNCQLPDERIGDFRAQFAANRLAVRRVQELCDHYGVEHLFAALEELLDSTERRMRAGLREIPDGDYTFRDVLDNQYLEQPLELVVAISKRADEISLDFTGCPPQGEHPLNMNWTATLATVYYALKALVDPEIAPNAGLYRPIHVSAPPGTIVNCVAPAAVETRTQTCQRVVDLIHGALADALPRRVTAAHNGGNSGIGFWGVHPATGKPYAYMETLGGGFGARATKDGLDGVQVHITNTSNLPIEALETTYPLRVRRYELVTDSGGAGRFRGGMGFTREIELVDARATAQPNVSRVVVPPWGLFDGRPGGCQSAIARRVDGSPIDMPGGAAGGPVKLGPGESLTVTTSGGGGYGDPRTRERALVLRDLREERISRQAAIEEYGLSAAEADAALLKSSMRHPA
jgi:N-methylhydantoinase B